MHKDTVRMRDYNALHGVPEFVLLFPEPEDARSVVWHQYEAAIGAYQVVALPADRRYRSQAIPGLELEVLEPSAWTLSRKVRVYYQGKEFRDAQVEEQFREAAEQQAQHAQQAREVVERQTQQERQVREAAERQVEHLLARLKQAGLEP